MKNLIKTIPFTLAIVVVLLSSAVEQKQIEVKSLKLEELPSSIKFSGDLVETKKWKDSNGENLLIVSRKGPIQETEFKIEFSGDERYAELFATQYLKKNGKYEVLWDIKDFVRHCPFDLWIGLLPKSTSITDLDKNGITETTLVYKLTCRSDVSPSKMKVLVHENDKKMGLRGKMILEMDKNRIDESFEYDLSKIKLSGLTEYQVDLEQSGRYENENDFEGAPQEFLNHAKALWKSFVVKDEFIQF